MTYYNCSQFHQLKLQGAFILSQKVNWRIHRNSLLKNFGHEKIVLCTYHRNLFFIFKQFDHHWKLLKTLDCNTYQGFLFLFFYTVIPGYFNEFIYEIMKRNISRVKYHNYKVLNLQVYLNSFGVNSWKPVILGHFLQKRWFYYKNAIFSTFTLWKWIFTKVLNHKCS